MQIAFSDLNKFHFGSDLISSINSLNFDAQDDKINMLLRSLGETLLELNLNDTHALRKDSGPNCEQIEINGFNGWRRDINYEYHLHYWKKGKDYIFSKVVTHNNFSITF